MPRIHDQLLRCTFFVYTSVQSARASESLGGTGFLVCVKFEKNPEYGQVYAVTNQHIVAACRTNVVLRLNSPKTGVEYVTTAKKDWMPHPSGVYDVAVLPIDLPQSSFGTYLPDEFFIDDQMIQCLNIGPGDDTFMVGRFVGYEGKKRNLSTVRFGNISAMPSDPIRVKGRDSGLNLLVECRSISGYSGSPVFVWIDPTRPRPPDWFSPAMPVYNPKYCGPWLLGIDAGHIQTELEIKHPNQTRKIGVAEFVTAMSVVVPVQRLVDTLQVPELIEHRNAEDEKITKKKEAGNIVQL